MVRSTALLVPIGLLLFSCKTVSVDKRSHRTPNPKVAKVIPGDISNESTTTADPSVPPTDMPAATPQGGKLWMMPQNSDEFTDLPSNIISSVWNEGDTIYTLHPGVGVGISTDFGMNWKTRTPANGLGNPALNDIFAQGSSIFIATGNGLLISQDKGETWSTVLGGEAFTRVVGTADKVYAVGETLRITIDKGKTWGQSSFPNGSCVNRLVVNGTNLYGIDPCSTGGIWLSADDGKNWKSTASAAVLNQVNDILFWKTFMFAGTNSGLFFSENNGENWNPTTLPGSARAVSFLNGSNARIYATVPPTTTGTTTTTGFVYSSDDGKTTWNERFKTPERVRVFGTNFFAFGAQGLYASRVDNPSDDSFRKPSLSPSRRAESISRGITVQDNIIYTIGSDGISSSANGGMTWTNASKAAPFKDETGGLYINSKTTTPTWYVPSSKGLYTSTDMGENWTLTGSLVVNSSNIPTTFAARSMTIDGEYFILATDKGMFGSNNSGGTWAQTTTNAVKFVKKVGKNLFVSNENGTFSFSANGGQSWKDVTDFTVRTTVTDIAETDTRLYASLTKGLGFSDDGGTKWTISTDPKWAQVKFTTSLDAQGKVVLVGTDSGVFISEDKGATFVTYPIGRVTGIAFRANTAFITTTQALYVFNPAAASLR